MQKPRRARRRELDDEDRDFGDQRPWKNLAALYGYRSSAFGLIPVLGLVLGPLAILLGAMGIWRHHKDESVGGYSQSRAAVFLGVLETVCNAVGIYLIARGIGWI